MAAALSRRRFVRGMAAIGGPGAALGPATACGRLPFEAQPKIPRIGLISTYPTYTAALQAFRDELRRRGYVAAQNVTIEYRDYQPPRPGETSAADLVSELVGLPVDVLVAHGMAAIAAAQDTPSTPPLVLLATDVGGQRLRLLVEAFPDIARIAALWNPSSPASTAAWQEAEAAAGPLGVQLQPRAVGNLEDLGRALDALAQAPPDGLLVTGDPPLNVIYGQARRILDYAATHRLPAIYPPGPTFASSGGLMVNGADDADLFARAAARATQALADPRQADRTVDRATKTDLTVNLATARAQGLTIAPSVLSQATEVIS